MTKRIFACLLDYIFFTVFFSFYTFAFGEPDTKGTFHIAGWRALGILAAWLIYFVAIEWREGATVGHMVFGLEVLSEDRMRITFIQALKRHLIDPIDVMLYGLPALIVISNTPKRQRLGDLWARTIVVDTKDPEQYIPEED